MAYIVRMPKLGMEMENGELLEWKVDVGESIEPEQVIAEVESEKTVAEVEARENGVLRSTALDPGEPVDVGTPMGIVAGPDEDVSDLTAEVASETGDAAVRASGGTDDAAEEGSGDESREPGETSGSPATGASDDRDVRASPRAKQRAEELGVDLRSVEGTGPQGAITADDVEAADVRGTDAPSDAEGETAGPTVLEERELGEMRRTIAERLGESYREAVHVTLHRDVRVDELLEATDVADDALETDVSVTDLLLMALSETLAEHPEFNATYEDGTHRLYAEQNVGVAVDVPEGLVAPVLRGLDGRSLPDLAESRREMTERTLDGEYSMADLQDGTFTVTNLGVLGVDSFDPVVNPPQVAILGVDRIRERPTAVDGEVTVASWMGFDLSFDHRVVDGYRYFADRFDEIRN
ncbi:dihydrolipoyllysine acetyltransferase [Halobacteriales archaeon QH_3_68_24]|nr:MAG: dihydrolipoyllysine acetyltransferase [Halobacteriales archaeon QH_3_68_24]